MVTEDRFERFLEARFAAREKRDEKIFMKRVKLEERAEQMIGELNSGKFYVFPVGGRYREGTKRELIDFLIRNNYV